MNETQFPPSSYKLNVYKHTLLVTFMSLLDVKHAFRTAQYTLSQ